MEEERLLLHTRLVPSIEQQVGEAEDDVEQWEAKVAAHPDWRWGLRELERVKKEAARLRSL